ncbi:MAG: hypothetical protein M3N46_07720 [Actinomycetota bacterium]|nr:hypothetical protein [Actinomycetota bacterium]
MTDASSADRSAPLRSDVKLGQGLIGGENAFLEWNGATLRLELDAGQQVFELSPDQILRVRDDQRMTLNFATASGNFQVYFEGVAGPMIDSSITGAFFPGAGVDAARAAALNSPANPWLALFRSLGIRVVDRTFVPPPARKIALITLGIVFGAVLLVCVIAFLVIAIQL